MPRRKPLTALFTGTAATTVIALIGVAGGAGTAAEPPPTAEQVRFFELKVRPVLAQRCYACHGPDKEIGGLRLNSRAAALKGGDSGPSLVPGHPEQSLLIRAINHDGRRMPPAGKLKAEEIAVLTEWVKMGAPWPTADPGGQGSGARGRGPTKLTAVDRIREARALLGAGGSGQKAVGRGSETRNSKLGTKGSDYWALLPVKRPAVPQGADGGWGRNVVDRFVWQRLQAAGLKPAPEADRATLVRRLYFDLIGLPPTPEEVDQFLQECEAEDRAAGIGGRGPGAGGHPLQLPLGKGESRTSTSPTPRAAQTPDPARSANPRANSAYERLVDRLLASPRYGEKWARHWLDLVRYADSDGYRLDEYRPHAWRYRDYVIKSFNDDKPYDRFVQEQLAADEMFPKDNEALVGLGYLRHWIYEYNARDVRGQWKTIMTDLTDTTGDVFLGLGIQCARCHDHKFDPILQKDYYRLQAFLAPVLPKDDHVVATPEQIAAHRVATEKWEAKTAALRGQIAALEAKYRKTAEAGAVNIFPPDIQVMIRKPVAEREPVEHQLAELAYRQVYFEYDRLDQRHIKGADKDKLIALKKQLSAFDAEKPEPLPVAPIVTDVGSKAPPVLIPKKGKEPVEPGFLTVLDEKPARIDPIPGRNDTTGRRTALARWLTRPENPLTARVMVNRVWQYHFGRGLAANASDFGRLGDAPTHPELLDYLASAFAGARGQGSGATVGTPNTTASVGWQQDLTPPAPLSDAERGESSRPTLVRGAAGSKYVLRNTQYETRASRQKTAENGSGLGWSLKQLHRLIVTSATYRQSTRHPEANRLALKDPENRLYWRGNTRRLDAEQIRDAMLAATGELDLKAGGPGGLPTDPRRTIYTRVMRNARDPFLDVFDLPLFFSSASSRDTTTTPVQSLLLFNSQTMLLRARVLAGRLEKETGGDEERMIVQAYRLTFGRSPSTEEIEAGRQFLKEQAARISPEQAGSAAAAFLHDKLPFRDGQAAVLSPEGPQSRFQVPHDPRLPDGDFTIEAFIQPRSVYDSGAVRTIAAKWNGDGRAPGWGFGITGKQSRRKPQTLVLQIIGKKLDGTVGEEAIFSDQLIQIGKPYFVSAAVKLARDGKPGAVTFSVKDLSNDDEPLLTARVEHKIAGGFANALPLTMGGRDGRSEAAFDGLVDDVRLSEGALATPELLYTTEGIQRWTIGYWKFEAKPDVFRDATGNGLDIRPAAKTGAVDPRRAALTDFCQALLNSSEFLYVD